MNSRLGSRAGLVLLVFLACPARAEEASGLNGSWAGTTTGSRGGEVAITLTVDGSAGTWRMDVKGVNRNPCVNRSFPIHVAPATDGAVSVTVENLGIVGCEHTATFRQTSDGLLDGVVDDNRPLALKRQ